VRRLKNELPRILFLSAACGIIGWHVFSWYAAGKYDEMYSWLGGDKAYLTVLYNLALMVVFGLFLGLLVTRIAELISTLGKRDGGRGKP
jgi:hypothetical protein